VKAAVVIFPGSNRDVDVIDALRRATGRPPATVWHRDTVLPDVDLVVLPGGFSYGDYLRSGAMAARSPIMRDVAARAARGTAVLGICNGFQILTEAGLLPGALLRNAGLRFVCRDVHLRVARNDTAFTRLYAPGQVIRIPVAHHDGNYYADRDTLSRIEDNGQVAFRYCAPDGAADAAANPNGSANGIAGIYNAAGNVLGLMPHPEDHVDPAQGSTDGFALFRSIAEFLS
jgi:phosphoribosylformylglycinamidine synthase I